MRFAALTFDEVLKGHQRLAIINAGGATTRRAPRNSRHADRREWAPDSCLGRCSEAVKAWKQTATKLGSGNASQCRDHTTKRARCDRLRCVEVL